MLSCGHPDECMEYSAAGYVATWIDDAKRFNKRVKEAE